MMLSAKLAFKLDTASGCQGPHPDSGLKREQDPKAAKATQFFTSKVKYSTYQYLCTYTYTTESDWDTRNALKIVVFATVAVSSAVCTLRFYHIKIQQSQDIAFIAARIASDGSYVPKDDMAILPMSEMRNGKAF